MKSPRVSICIPSYCQIDFLRETLRSVKAQNFQDYELIIFDDTPDDSVAQLVASFDFDDRLYYQHNSVALGSPANWNAAVRHAKGDYIKLLHHDDKFSHPDALETFVRLLDENPKADFAFSASSAQNATLSKNYIHCASETQVANIIEVPERLFLSNIIGAPSATIYRNGLPVEYDGRLQWLVDIDFYIRLLSGNSQLSYTPEVLIDTTTDAAHQITAKCKNNAAVEMFEYLYLYEKVAAKITDDPSVQSVWFSLFEKYQIYSQTDLKKQGIELSAEILQPIFMAYRQIWFKRTPYRIYAHLPESLKRVVKFLFN